MPDNTVMYKSQYKTIPGLPLTETIPALLEWKGVSPYRVEEETGGDIKQVSIHRICCGDTKNPKLPVVEKIARYFGLSFTQLYDRDLIKGLVSGAPEDQDEIEKFLEVMRERLKQAEALERKELMAALLVLSK